MTNVGAVIERDPDTFRKLKRVVIMGGSVHRGYNDLGYTPDHGPDPEYNIASDIASARRLFTSGVPLYVMPLDSTQLKLDEVKRELIFQQSTPLTDALTLLYHLWGQQTPTLYDPVAVAFSLEPQLCPNPDGVAGVSHDAHAQSRPGAKVAEQPGPRTILADGEIQAPVAIIVGIRRAALLAVHDQTGTLTCDWLQPAPAVAE